MVLKIYFLIQIYTKARRRRPYGDAMATLWRPYLGSVLTICRKNS